MTADERLTLILSKSDRAKKHFGELQAELRAFQDSKPYKVEAKRDPETRRPVYYLIGIQETPATLSLIIGDALQCLRSTLDHLAYQLVVIASPSADPSKAFFPITRDVSTYQSQLRRIEDLLRPSAFEAIRALEAYQGGKSALLWTLHNLNNIDKHRAVLTTFARTGGVDMIPEFLRAAPGWANKLIESMQPFFIREADPAPAKAGDLLYIGGVDHEVDEHRKFAFEIAFAEPGVIEGKPVGPTLHEMMNLVNGIVTAFWREGHLA